MFYRKHMVRISISGAVRGKSTNGPDGSEVWERVRNQEKERCFSLFYIEF